MAKRVKNREVIVPDSVGEKDLAVVPREYIFSGRPFSGVAEMDETELFDMLTRYMLYRERTQELEQDASMKQVIPYFVVRKGNDYLTARRRDKSGDKRLHGGRLIGFGGHLRAGDIKGKMSDWLTREFDEEIEAKKVTGVRFLGIVNHDGNEDNGVHKVHFGLVFEVKTEGEVRIRETENFQDEEFLNIAGLVKKRDEMELWSRLVTDFLAK